MSLSGFYSRKRLLIIKLSIACLYLIVFLGALLVRLYGLDFGLPYLYEPDEPAFVSGAMGMLKERDLNPHSFQHPGSTTLYSLAGLYAAVYAAGKLLGYFPDPQAFAAAYYRDPSLVYLSGRLLMVGVSLLCLGLVFLITRRLCGKWAALLAGAIFAFSPLVVEYSRLIRTDLQLTLFLLAAFWFCLNILDRNRWRDYLLAGGAIGLAVATKYPGAFFIPTLLLAHFIARPFSWREQWKLASAGMAILVGLVIGSPFLLPEYRLALAGLALENRAAHLGATGSGFFDNLGWYVTRPLPKALTLPGIFLLAFGTLRALMSRRKDFLLLAFTPVLYLLLIASLHLRWERWLIPALPFFAILMAEGARQLVEFVQKRLRSAAWAAAAAAGIVCLVLLPMLLTDVRSARALAGIDTRTLGREWILQQVPQGKKLLLEVYSPQLPREAYEYFVAVGSKLQLVSLDGYTQAEYRPIWGFADDLGKIANPEEICSLGIEYIVMSQRYQQYLREAEAYPQIIARYQEIMALGPVIQEFNPIAGKTPGPKLQVIRVEKCG